MGFPSICVESNQKPYSLFQGIMWALGILEKRGSAPSVMQLKNQYPQNTIGYRPALIPSLTK
jgi:hypothetical protein